MPRLCRDFYGISVFINFNDHLPPHFHAFYQEHEILININDLSVYAGHFPPRAFSIINEWANIYQQELKQEWAAITSSLSCLKLTKPLP